MRLSLGSAAAVAAFLVTFGSLYACSSDGGGDGGDDAGGSVDGSGSADGTGPGADGASSSDGATGGDGASGADGGDAGGDGGADATVDAAPDAGPPRVVFLGRFDESVAGSATVSWPASRIIARFSGTAVSATFSDAMLYQDYGPTRWEVIVDGVSTMVLSLTRPPAPMPPTDATYTLASGLAAGAHTVELVKLTESSVGVSTFKGFTFPGGALLPPPLPKPRHMEFLGDSASNGYGVEGATPSCAFTSATENANLAYPALIAKDLGADHHNLSASGKGVLRNYYRPDTEVFSVIYPRTLPFTGGSAWDFTQYTPDVVWMTLGGNDYDVFNNDPPPDFNAFQTKYGELVTLVRSKHPNAHIFCAVATSLSDTYPVGYNAYTNVKTAVGNVVAAKSSGGDAKVHFFEFTRAVTATDLTGCGYHPNAAKHRAMADEAIAFIKSKVAGW